MKEHDPLAQWKAALIRELEASGMRMWSGAPKNHPYIRYEPTLPNPRPRVTKALTGASLRRAIDRARTTETLMAWIPRWMHVALFDPKEQAPFPWKDTKTLLELRYLDEHEPAALDAIAMLEGNDGVWSYIRSAHRYARVLAAREGQEHRPAATTSPQDAPGVGTPTVTTR